MCVCGRVTKVWSSAGWQTPGISFPWTCWSGYGETYAPLVGAEGEQSVFGVRTVLDDATCLSLSLALEGLDWGEWETSNVLDSFHHLLQRFPVRDRAVAIPYCDTVGKDALSCVVVYKFTRIWGDRWTFFILLSKKRHWWAFLIRVKVLRVQERSVEMWTPRNLKLLTQSSVPLVGMGCVCHHLTFCSPQWALWSLAVRCWISSL